MSAGWIELEHAGLRFRLCRCTDELCRCDSHNESARLVNAAWTDALRRESAAYWQQLWTDPDSSQDQRSAALWVLTEKQRRDAEKAASRHLHVVPTEQLVTVACEWCGKQFRSERRSAKYCSRSHEARAYRARHARRVGLSGVPEAPRVYHTRN